jgi:hypothetical protein
MFAYVEKLIKEACTPKRSLYDEDWLYFLYRWYHIIFY